MLVQQIIDIHAQGELFATNGAPDEISGFSLSLLYPLYFHSELMSNAGGLELTPDTGVPTVALVSIARKVTHQNLVSHSTKLTCYSRECLWGRNVLPDLSNKLFN